VIKYQFFPRSQGINERIKTIINCFEKHADSIASPENNLTSNEVLEVIRPDLEAIDFKVETGEIKKRKNKCTSFIWVR